MERKVQTTTLAIAIEHSVVINKPWNTLANTSLSLKN